MLDHFVLESRVMIMPTQHSPNVNRTPPSRKHTDFVAEEMHFEEDDRIRESQRSVQRCDSQLDGRSRAEASQVS